MANESQHDEHLPAVKIMRLWGSNARFARAIGRAPSTTMRYIAQGYFVGFDAAGLIADIHAAARRDCIALKPEHFVDLRLFENEEQAAAMEAARS